MAIRGKQIADNSLDADKLLADSFDATAITNAFATGAWTEAAVDAAFAAAAIDTDRLKEGSGFVKSDGSVAMAAALNMGGTNKVTNLADGSASSDAATYGQLQSVAAGLDPKESVRVATATDLDSNSSISGTPSYNNTGGSSGRGQITATLAVSGTFTVDDVSLANDDRVLIKDESGGLGSAANGIYTVTISGTSLTLDRAADFDADAEVTAGAYMPVEEGAANGDRLFLLTTNDPITIGGGSGTALTFASFGALNLGGTPTTVTPGASAAEGTSNSGARSDHTHDVSTGAPSSDLSASTSNAEGSAASLARSDHSHAISTGAPSGSIDAGDTNTEGSAASLARSDHQHAVSTGAAGTASIGDTAGEGTSTNLARADHTHAISSDDPEDVATAGSEGSAGTFARSDHKHRSPWLRVNDYASPSGATSGNFSNTGQNLTYDPRLGSDILVFVNGVQVRVANSVAEAQGSDAECYFATTGDTDGSQAIAIANVEAGHELYWKGTNAGYQLDTSDVIKFSYLTYDDTDE